MQTTQTTISIFGDSIAYGECDKSGGWVNRLKLYFDKNKFKIKVCNLGVSGDTTEEVINRFYDNSCVKISDKIIFAIGINDSIFLTDERQNMVPIEKFEKNIKNLIIKSREITEDITFIGLTPVNEELTNPTPLENDMVYTNLHIKNYNNKIKQICKKEKIKFIDLYNKFIQTENYKNFLADGLHPNSKGHKLIFEVIKQNLF